MEVIGWVFWAFFFFVGEWWLLQHFHETTLKPSLDAMLDRILRHQEIALDKYHEDKLLPAITLLASNNVPCAPPAIEVEKEKAPARFERPQLTADQVENIWGKVNATF